MEMILSEKYTERNLGPNYITTFYLSRFWRLYPVYLTTCLAIACAALLLDHSLWPESLHAREFTSLTTLAQMLAIWVSNVTMFGLNIPSTKSLLIGPGWSLGVEISFYLIAPFILKARTRTVATCAAIGIVLQFIPYGQHAPVLFGVPFFLLGAAAYRKRKFILDLLPTGFNPKTVHVYIALAPIVLISIPHDIHIARFIYQAHNSLDRNIYPIIIAIVIPIAHEATKKNRLDYWIGQLSYPFYLTHEFAIRLFQRLDVSNKLAFTLLTCIVMSGAIVYLENRIIEPWRLRLHRINNARGK